MNRNRSRRSVRPWYIGLLGAIAAAVIIFGITQLGVKASTARTSSETVTAADGVVQSTVSGSGNVEPGVDDDVNFATSGTLESVDVKVGEHVKKGQLLATLDPSSADLTLKQDETTLKSAQDALTSEEEATFSSSTSTTSSGTASTTSSGTASTTSSGTTSSDNSSTTDSSDQSTTSDATASAAAASGSGHTTTTGVTTPTVTGQSTTGESTSTTTEATTKETAAEKRAAAKKEAEEKAAEKKQKAKEEAEEKKQKAAEKKETAKEKSEFEEDKSTAVAQDEETVQRDEETVVADKKAVTETKLYAPASGTIASLGDYSVGDSVSAGSDSTSSSTGSADDSSTGSSSSTSTAFAEIVNNKTMTMTVSLSEDDISSIKVGQTATVSLTALSGVELAGKVTEISPLGTESDDVVSYDATITVYQSNSKVLAGMSATAEIVTEQQSGVTIPSDAVTGSGSDASVELVKDGKVVTTPVTVGLKGTDRDVITSGLEVGDEVRVTVTLPSLSSSSTTSTTSTTSATGASGFGSGGFGSGGAGFPAGGGFSRSGA